VRPEEKARAEKARAAEEKARAGVERMEDQDLDDEEVIVMRAAPPAPAPAPPPMPLPPQEPHFVEYGLVGAIGGENEAQELWPTLSQAVAMPAPAAASAPIIEPPSSVVVGTGEGVARRGEVDISCVAMLTQLLQEKVVNRSGKRRRPIVLDASNVAVALGKSKTFEVRGIVEALRYWIKRGHRTVGFIPHWRVHGRIFENTKARPMAPEQQPLLRALVEAELLHTTPSQDYDDSYIIEFARQTKAYVVSNDQFRDWVDKQPSSERKEAAAAWVTKHVMTYTFVGTDFFPNPDFALQAAKDSGFDKTES